MSRNPFQLKRVGGGAPADKLYKPLTEDEMRAKLVGYIKIPKDGWHLLSGGTAMHIRYVETVAAGGKFKSGGFIQSNSIQDDDGNKSLRLKSSLFRSGNYKEWFVPYNDIEHLYCKMTPCEYAIQQDLKAVVAALTAEIKKLKSR